MTHLSEPANRLGDLLLQRQWIDPAQLRAAVAEQRTSHRPLGEILVARQTISHRQLQRALKWQQLARMAMLVTSVGMALPQLCQAGDTRPHALAERGYQLDQNQWRNNLSRLDDSALASQARQWLGTGGWALLRGEYTTGDRYTEGIRYRASWSAQSLKLEFRYQF